MPTSRIMKTYYPPAGFYFTVSFAGIKGKKDASFKEVSGLHLEMGVEEIAEGGENRFKHRVPAAAKFQNIVLKRGLVRPNSEVAIWAFNSIGGGLSKALKPKNLTISLLNEKGNPTMTWSFVNAWPVKWEVGPLNSMENALSVETMEFAYSYMTITK